MGKRDIFGLINKIRLKELNNMDAGQEHKELKDTLEELTSNSESLTSAFGLDDESMKELESIIGSDRAFPMRDLEITITYAEATAELLDAELDSKDQNSEKIKALINRIACVQWHFNRVSKPLTKEYLQATPASSYILISPYIEVDREMAKEELKSYFSILKETKDVLNEKDLKALYKCNADLMTVSTNLTQYRYCI